MIVIVTMTVIVVMAMAMAVVKLSRGCRPVRLMLRLLAAERGNRRTINFT